jgi:hypothetical protein
VRQGHVYLFKDSELEEGLKAFNDARDKDWLCKLDFNNHSIEAL